MDSGEAGAPADKPAPGAVDLSSISFDLDETGPSAAGGAPRPLANSQEVTTKLHLARSFEEIGDRVRVELADGSHCEGAALIGAVLGTIGGAVLRGKLSDRHGIDLPVALTEDAVAVLGGFTVAALAGIL